MEKATFECVHCGEKSDQESGPIGQCPQNEGPAGLHEFELVMGA